MAARGQAHYFETTSPCLPTSHTNRVFIGAALSTIDLITDIYITYTFWKEEWYNFFKCSVAMLVTSMFLMAITISVQNYKLGLRKVMVEMIPAIVGLKSAVDAFRVASGATIKEGQVSFIFRILFHHTRSSYLPRLASFTCVMCLQLIDPLMEMVSHFLFSLFSLSLVTALGLHQWDDCNFSLF